VGLNALAQKAYKWGNSFQEPNKDTKGKFGRYPASYVQRGTLSRYAPRQQLRATPSSQMGSSNVMAGANISPAFVAKSKEVEQLCAKWQQINVEEFLGQLQEEDQYSDAYPDLLQEAAALVEYRRKALVLLKNPHDPATEEQLKHLSQEAYMAASKIDLIILKMVTKEVETNKEAIVKGVELSKKAQQASQGAGIFAPDMAALDEDDDLLKSNSSVNKENAHVSSKASIFDKEWLEERQKYLYQSVLIWRNRFEKETREGGKIFINWDRSDPFLQEGRNAWVEAIETETFIKGQLARY
jgi:hypothetical protein